MALSLTQAVRVVNKRKVISTIFKFSDTNLLAAMKKCIANGCHMIHHGGMRSCFTLSNDGYILTEFIAYPRLKYGLKRCDFKSS